ncbi:MAG TPA: amino acid adenylation domain-containing protein [Aldersonia sp.]
MTDKPTAAHPTRAPIPAGAFGLSGAQRGIWLAQQLAGRVPVAIAQYVEFHGDLDPVLLADVGRIAAEEFGSGYLRLIESDGEPYQLVDRDLADELEIVDLRGHPDPVAAATAWMHREYRAPIDMYHDRLGHSAVLWLADDHCYWYTRVHHVVLDGFGAVNLMNRVAELYSAAVEGRRPEQPPAADLTAILAADTDYRSSQRFRTDREFWADRIADIPSGSSLSARTAPAAHPRVVGAALPRRTTALLDSAATAHGSSVPVLVVAAFAAYLARMTDSDEIVLSLPVSARTTAALRRAGGMVSNVLPIRFRIGTTATLGRTVADLVTAARIEISATLRRQRYRQEDLRRDAAARGVDLGSFGPSINIMMFHDEIRLASLTGSLRILTTGPVEDLSVNVYPGIAGCDTRIDFAGNPARYSVDELDTECRRFREFLDRFLAAAPHTQVCDLELLAPAERELVVARWNATTAAIRPTTLPDLFDAQVAHNPRAVALTYRDHHLSYVDLDARVNRLARYLISLGAGPESLVGIAIRRSVDTVVATYAVVKAGAAYLALDPDHPRRRLANALESVAPKWVLTTSQQAHCLPPNAATVAIDTVDTSSLSAAPITDAERRATLRPENIAYVTFTSGSTGTPKSVAVSHAGICNQLLDLQAAHPLDDTDAMVAKTPPAFDASAREMWWPLSAGARLVIAEPDGHHDPAYLARLIAEQRVTTVHFVPSVLSMFLADAPVERLSSLRRVFCGGEALSPGALSRFRARLSAPIHNVYGPAEVTISATRFACGGPAPTVPIGSPVWNTQAFVLDRRLEPCPVGGVGELYLAGVQLARGYLGSPGTTSDRFVANPFHGSPGARMYRTGDLVRRSGDGNLEFLGRIDTQVKVRGVRIELGEIESALCGVAGVAGAAATVHDGPLGQRLIGYVVPVPGHRPNAAELLDHLGATLPNHMMPETILVLDALPLNGSGKLDRAALPVPDEARHEPAFRQPSTPAETAIAGVFADVLGLDRVGANDSFFGLGGNSLVATRLVSRVNAVIPSDIGIRDVFEAPTVAGLASRAEAAGAGRPRPPLVAAARPARLPLSPAQRRMWLVNQMTAAAPLYSVPLALRLSGNLDREALAHAVGDVIGRHESLRTVYPVAGGGPVQVILPASEIARRPAAIDIELDPVRVRDLELSAQIRRLVRRGFDVTTEVPLRVRLFQLSDADFVIVFVAHHICGDGLSLAPLARDLAAAYRARARGRAPDWTPLPVQYADYALWHLTALGSEDDPESVVARQLGYWQGALAAMPDRLVLPSGRSRPARPSHRGASTAIAIDAAAHRRLIEIAGQHDSSVFMAVHAALAVLLGRLSGTRDIAVGTPVAGRGEPALDDLVGMFVNTVVLRVQVDPAESFTDLLARVRETDLRALACAEVPFDRIVELVNPERGAELNPLFQVMLTFQNMAALVLDLDGLTVAAVELDSELSRYELHLTLSESFDAHGGGRGITGTLRYATDCYDAASMTRFADRFGRVLAAIASDPGAVVGDIDLSDRTAQTDLRRGTCHSESDDATLVSMFEAQAQRSPDAIAVVCDADVLTYRELDLRVDRFARHLISLGVRPEALVGLAVRRSVELLVGMYAIARAGGAYVPIDPDNPAAHTADLLAALSVTCVLTTTGDGGALPPGTPTVELDRMDPIGPVDDSPVPSSGRGVGLRPDNLAYVIHTSGSTGRPKGVMVSHRSVVNSIRWRQSVYELDATDTVLLKTPATFDASVRELWWPLTAGARLIIAGPADHRDPRRIAEMIAAHDVTSAHFVPAMLAAVVTHATGDQLGSLRQVFCGGEVLQPATVRAFRARSAATVHNEFGPTETAVSVTRRRVRADDPAALPIGVPQRNVEAHVLDGRLHPVPIGVTGELYVSGIQLARGYLGRVDLTAERFVADPFGTGGRMYRTGDLARRRADGNLEFVGRADDQVKIRGLRIELGEIEARLAAHRDVAQCAVAVRDTAAGEQQLTAYLVAKPGAELDTGSVQSAAALTLPPYMVPSVYEVLAELPRGVNGKIDRRALPDPVVPTRTSRAPASRLEKLIADVFADVLGVATVGADDDLFERGGNSLVAVRVAARLKADCGIELPLQAMFVHPTPAAIAARIESVSGGGPTHEDSALDVLIPLRSRGRLTPLFCVHPIVGLSWSFAGLARHLHPERGIYGLQSPLIGEDGASPDSIAAWARRFVEEIRAVQRSGPYHLLGWSMGGVVAHAMAVQLQAEGDEVGTLAMLDSFVRSDPARAASVTLADVLGGIGLSTADTADAADDVGAAALDPDRVCELAGELTGALRAVTPERVARIVDSAHHSTTVLSRHRPSRFRGDLLYFAATLPAAPGGPAHRDGAAGWRSVVSGTVRVHRVPAAHWQMTSPAALAEIGPILEEQLCSTCDYPTTHRELA